MTQISKPYLHGTKWRCRIKTPDGWRWVRPSIETPEAATALAQNIAGGFCRP